MQVRGVSVGIDGPRGAVDGVRGEVNGASDVV